jgi:hypothetical protein
VYKTKQIKQKKRVGGQTRQKYPVSKIKHKQIGWGYIEHLSGMCKTLGSVLSTEKKKKQHCLVSFSKCGAADLGIWAHFGT